MERRMVSMNWDRLDDDLDDDDEFYESTNRISAVVPLDVPLSEFDLDEEDEEFNDSRVSFSNNVVSCKSFKEIQNVAMATATSNAQYDMWMMAPGSVTDRRRKLLQGMGLNSNRDFARVTTTKLNKAMTKRVASRLPEVSSLDVNISNEKPILGKSVAKQSSKNLQGLNKEEQKQPQMPPQPKPQPPKPQTQQQHEPQPEPHIEREHVPVPEPEPKPEPEPEPEPEPQEQARNPDQAAPPSSSIPILLVRCRSDSDIDTSSFNTKRRKEEMIGSISKQRLTKTSSELIAPSVGLSCQYANVLRVSKVVPKKSSQLAPKIKKNANETSSAVQFDSFFLIKNLDTGKEFIVKESNEEGVWNKVSDLQTGKQLTMDEFEKTVGHSPVVKELMRRASLKKNGNSKKLASTNSYLSKSFRYSKKKGAKLLKNFGISMSGSSKTGKEKDTSVTNSTTNSSSSSSQTTGEKKPIEEKKPTGEQNTSTGDKKSTGEPKKQKTIGEQKSNVEKKSTGEPKKEKTSGEQKTDEGQKTSTDKNSTSEWVKCRAHGKPIKEFSALHLCQEIQAHDGPIWTMRFSIDGSYLASAGEDKVIHVWEVQECDVMSMQPVGDDKSSGVPPDNKPPLPDNSATEKKKKGKNNKKKGEVPDYAKVPDAMFGLSEKPVCTFEGHQEDVLDLSWSRTQLLLSSSMDKTVRLWDVETKNCLKQFAHRDYVTCIQFNPTDDNYFISGSLDTKVRLWSIPGQKVIHWSDLHDMVTSVSYSPDGKGAIVGLHKGSCKSYSTIDCKLEEKDELQLHTKPNAEPKKITGFQFSPSNPSEVLVTSADSRIRILDGPHVVNKLIGYKNTTSQFSAQYSADGRYIVCASEDSQVYIWKHEKTKHSGAAKPKYVTTTSYEHFPCTEVTVVQPWHGCSKFQRLNIETQPKGDSKRSAAPLAPMPDGNEETKKPSEKSTNPAIEDSEQPSDTSVAVSESGDGSFRLDGAHQGNSNNVQSTAWGLVIVTAGEGGQIRVYQNVGLPVKLGILN